MVDQKFIILIPGLIVILITFILGTIVNSSIIFKIIQKPKSFLNYSCELNISILGFIVCFCIGGFHIVLNILILMSVSEYPDLCCIEMSCSTGLQVSFIVNLIILSYRRNKRIQAIDGTQVFHSHTGFLCVLISWIIGLIITSICLVILFTENIHSHEIGYGCEFVNQSRIKVIHYILFCIFLCSVITITCTNFKILKFLQKPVVCPMSAVCPAVISRPEESKDNERSSNSIHTQQLMNVPEQLNILLNPQISQPIIKKSSCSSISSMSSINSHTQITNVQRSQSIYSSAKEDDGESDGSIYSHKSNIPIQTGQHSKNEILARLNNTRKIEKQEIKLFKNDISKLTNCEYKQNLISNSHLKVADNFKIINIENPSQSESRIPSTASVSSFSCSDYSVHYLWEEDRLGENIIMSKNATINETSDSTDGEKNHSSDSDSKEKHSSISEDGSEHEENCDKDCYCCQHNNDDAEDIFKSNDSDSDNGGDESTTNKMEHIYSRPRLQPIPMRRKQKRKYRGLNSYKNRLTLSNSPIYKNSIQIHHISEVPKAILSKRRKAIVNFEFQISGGQAPNLPFHHPTRRTGIRWNESMNMPVVLTRRHRMKKIVFRNLMLELAVYVIFMSSACLKNVFLYEYDNANIAVKSLLYFTESIHLLLFAINPFLYILKNKNIMNEL